MGFIVPWTRVEAKNVEYASSGRSSCKRCDKKIANKAVRIALGSESFGDSLTFQFFHPECVNYARGGIAQVSDLGGHKSLKKADKDKLAKIIESGGSAAVRSPAAKSKAKPKAKPKQAKSATAKGRAAKAAPKTAARKRKAAVSSSDSESEYEDGGDSSATTDDDDSSASSSSGSEYDSPPPRKRARNAAVAAAKSKKKGAKAKDPEGIEARVEKQKEGLAKFTVAKLKELLRHNHQLVGGAKPELLDRVADAVVNGTLPKCPKCFGGSLHWDDVSEVYRCKGFMDDEDFHFCRAKFEPSELKRGKWKWLDTE